MPKRIIPPGIEPASRIVTAWPAPGQVVGGGEPRGPGADDQHPLAARRRRGRLEAPALADRLVAEEALDRVDPDRLVELAAVAGGLAGVVTDPPHDRRERVVLGQLAPGALVAAVALLGLVQPGLHVLAGRAGVVAGRHPVDVDGAFVAPAAGVVGAAGADVEGDRVGLGAAHRPSLPRSRTRPRPAVVNVAIALGLGVEQAELADVAVGAGLQPLDDLRVAVLAEQVGVAALQLQVLGDRDLAADPRDAARPRRRPPRRPGRARSP